MFSPKPFFRDLLPINLPDYWHHATVHKCPFWAIPSHSGENPPLHLLLLNGYSQFRRIASSSYVCCVLATKFDHTSVKREGSDCVPDGPKAGHGEDRGVDVPTMAPLLSYEILTSMEIIASSSRSCPMACQFQHSRVCSAMRRSSHRIGCKAGWQKGWKWHSQSLSGHKGCQTE